MERLQTCTKMMGTLGAAAGVLFAEWATRLLVEYALPKWVSLLLALAIVALSLVVFQEGAQYLLGNSSILRRLVLGSRYVEGAWIDAVYNEDKLTSVALLRIQPDGDEIRLSGDLYSPSGNSIGLVRTDMVVTQWPVMKYKYTSVRSGAQMPPSQGYCEIQFDEQSNPPSRFYGYYSDLLRPYRCDLVGRRLTKAELPSLLTKEGRMALVAGFVAEEEQSRLNSQWISPGLAGMDVAGRGRCPERNEVSVE